MLLHRLSAIALMAGLAAGMGARGPPDRRGDEAMESSSATIRVTSDSAVHPRFDLSSADTSPFPSNAFAVSDPSHLTGLRVKVPYPDCSVQRSDCEDVRHLNDLDGFNLLPRLSIPFDGDIDPASVSSRNVLLLHSGTQSRSAIGAANGPFRAHLG